ncbi:MAG: hypothetical protein JST18_04870 [Bacteroidetes bacterium]|nr:hypothetical protein [Bacteroidota bacterium]
MRHYVFVALLTSVISLSLFLVFVLDHPFDGPSQVNPDPLVIAYSQDTH